MDRIGVARANFERILQLKGLNPFVLARETVDENGRPFVRTYFDDFIRGRKNSLKNYAMYAAARYLDCSFFYLTGDIQLAPDATEYAQFEENLSGGPSAASESRAHEPAAKPVPPNAEVGGPVSLSSSHTIPVYGQAIGGDDGQFVLNGNHVADVLAPPALRGVRGAYGVYVAGESMEPRYFAGEVVYVDPTRPVRRGDFVVVQIVGEDEDDVSAYVKRFVSSSSRELVLEQYNPSKQMKFPSSRVKSVHRVVMGGEG